LAAEQPFKPMPDMAQSNDDSVIHWNRDMCEVSQNLIDVAASIPPDACRMARTPRGTMNFAG
jgi:hypothetical protein